MDLLFQQITLLSEISRGEPHWSEFIGVSGIARGWGWGGSSPPPPEILKALQNRTKLNPTVKTVKNC